MFAFSSSIRTKPVTILQLLKGLHIFHAFISAKQPNLKLKTRPKTTLRGTKVVFAKLLTISSTLKVGGGGGGGLSNKGVTLKVLFVPWMDISLTVIFIIHGLEHLLRPNISIQIGVKMSERNGYCCWGCWGQQKRSFVRNCSLWRTTSIETNCCWEDCLRFSPVNFLKMLFLQLSASCISCFDKCLLHCPVILTNWLFHQLVVSSTCCFINLLFH